jgi:hypothetical protein
MQVLFRMLRVTKITELILPALAFLFLLGLVVFT